ncbi:hypothetical protein Taro_000409 [Colocasia esculenta]|uniref:Uncharacterized protein n=1 Tax=Colocasia esculenta TaxID=4460 RepID=A0A843TAR7_COLES|nr:hypothetical protein [Colocasia esculenta]
MQQSTGARRRVQKEALSNLTRWGRQALRPVRLWPSLAVWRRRCHLRSAREAGDTAFGPDWACAHLDVRTAVRGSLQVAGLQVGEGRCKGWGSAIPPRWQRQRRRFAGEESGGSPFPLPAAVGLGFCPAEIKKKKKKWRRRPCPHRMVPPAPSPAGEGSRGRRPLPPPPPMSAAVLRLGFWGVTGCKPKTSNIQESF